jgi:hypothetical protein
MSAVRELLVALGERHIHAVALTGRGAGKGIHVRELGGDEMEALLDTYRDAEGNLPAAKNRAFLAAVTVASVCEADGTPALDDARYAAAPSWLQNQLRQAALRANGLLPEAESPKA